MKSTNKYILAIDAGTTSSRAILFDKNAEPIQIAQYEFNQIFPKEGWVEHDALEIWNTQLKAVKDVINNSKIEPNQIDSIGITNQRETTVIWNKKTGIPVFNAIVPKRSSPLLAWFLIEGSLSNIHLILVPEKYASITSPVLF